MIDMIRIKNKQKSRSGSTKFSVLCSVNEVAKRPKSSPVEKQNKEKYKNIVTYGSETLGQFLCKVRELSFHRLHQSQAIFHTKIPTLPLRQAPPGV